VCITIGSLLRQPIVSRHKQETEQVVRNGMEEHTARNKQAEAWGAALLVFAQNMGIPTQNAHTVHDVAT